MKATLKPTRRSLKTRNISVSVMAPSDECINYRALLGTATQRATRSRIFEGTLTPEAIRGITQASSTLPQAGAMRDLEACAAIVQAAVTTHARGAPGLALTLLSHLAEDSARCGDPVAQSDTPGSSADETAAAGGATARNPLSGLPPSAGANYLLSAIDEPATQHPNALRILKKHGSQVVWRLLEAARGHLARQDDPVCFKAGTEKRTLGGIFYQLEKKVASKANAVAVVAAAPAPMELRSYQQRCVDAIMAPGRNFIVAAPTGSGKSAIFVEAARQLLLVNGEARVVVIVPTVPLTTQQYAEFIKGSADFGRAGWGVMHFSTDSKLLPHAWPDVFKSLSVVVCTAQILLNALQSDLFKLDQLDMLVLDECHHATKEHPYHLIVQYYNPDVNKRTKMLGFSASPVNGATKAELDFDLDALRARLHAEVYTIVESDAEVAAVIASPEERDVLVPARALDVEAEQLLTDFIWRAACVVGEAALAASEAPAASPAMGVAGQGQLKKLIQAVRLAQANGTSEALPALEVWNCAATSMASSHGMPSMALCSKLIRVACRAVALVADAGYEAALGYLAHKCCGLSIAHQAAAMDPRSAPPAINDAFRRLAAAAAAAPTAGGRDDLGALRAYRFEQQAALQGGARGGSGEAEDPMAADAPTRRGPDLEATSVVLLARHFLGLLELQGALGRGCFRSGALTQEATFPKLWALLEYLQTYRDRDAGFHGIVFVSTRHGVYVLADAIRRCDQLAFVEVCEFVGHGDTSGRSLDVSGGARDRHVRGMTGVQQLRALAQFKTPGNKLMVSTSALEEGIDVPTCEFVVRYNAAATGTQRLQSRGRARVRAGAEFVCLVQDGTLDSALHRKSRREATAITAHLATL